MYQQARKDLGEKDTPWEGEQLLRGGNLTKSSPAKLDRAGDAVRRYLDPNHNRQSSRTWDHLIVS
jgi:hypothetical protein